jgi:hypothetical protein
MGHSNLAGAALVSMLAFWIAPCAARAGETVDFQVAWIAVGEAAASTDEQAARAGRQLFTAADLARLNGQRTRAARVAIEPEVLQVTVGEQICIGALQIRVFGADGRQISGAPLTITVRKDQREQLQLARSSREFCMRPSRSGEYAVRFTSLLPAPDGSTRGAQMFLRASERAIAAD